MASHNAVNDVAKPPSDRSHDSVVGVCPWAGRSMATIGPDGVDHVAPEHGVGEHAVHEQRDRPLADVEIGDLAERGGGVAAMCL
jgi:hypothetical protein